MTSANPRILLIGGTGAIGRHVLSGVVGESRVRALARTDESAKLLEQQGVDEVVRGDLSAIPAGIFRDVDGVFLLTPDQGPQELAAIDAAAAAGVGRIVKVSSREVALSPAQAAGPAILAIEAHLRAAPLVSTILRPDHFMSNLAKRIDELRTGTLSFAGGGGALAWIDPRDIAAAAVTALLAEQPRPGIFDLTGPETLTFPEAAATLSAALGREVRYVPIGDAELRARMAAAGAPARFIEMYASMFDAIRERPHPSVTDGVLHLTGRSPRSLATYAKEVLRPLLEGTEPAASS